MGRGLAFALGLVCCVDSHAFAQSVDAFGIERFRLATDGGGILDVEWADVTGHKSWGLGLWVGFASDPLVLHDNTMPNQPRAGALVERRLTTGLVGSVALWNRLQIGVAFDAVGYQASGDDVGAVMGIGSLGSSGAGDLRVAPKLLLVGGGRSRFHVALIPSATVPMGKAGDFMREHGPVFAPELAIAWGDRVRIAVNAGYRIREKLEVADLVVDDEVFARVGIGLRIGAPGDPAAELDVSGSLAIAAGDRQANQNATETMAGGSVRLSRSMRLFAAGGVGLDRGFGTPEWRALGGVRVTAVRGDRDGDRIEDVVDRCPNEAEDRDGYDDGDGCIDPDNDGDGIADAKDRKPNDAEDKDGWQDDDGAPDPDNDGDGLADGADQCPNEAEDKDGVRDDDGCVDRSGTVRGKILDASQRPIAGAAIAITSLDHPSARPVATTTADDGTFTAEVHAGAVKVTVDAASYNPAEESAKVAEGQASELAITLVRIVQQGQLRGQVLAYDGKPLAATVSVAGKGTATTDAEGFYVLDLPEGSFEIVVEAKGHAAQRKTVTVRIDRVTVINIDMRRGKTR